MEQYLRDNGCTEDELLLRACQVGQLDMVKDLIEDHNCDPTKGKQ